MVRNHALPPFRTSVLCAGFTQPRTVRQSAHCPRRPSFTALHVLTLRRCAVLETAGADGTPKLPLVALRPLQGKVRRKQPWWQQQSLHIWRPQLQVELHGIGDGDRLLLWRGAADDADALRMVVRPAAEPVEHDDVDTDSDDDVALCRPAKRPRAAVDATVDPHSAESPAAPVDGLQQPRTSSWDGYVEPGCAFALAAKFVTSSGPDSTESNA